MKKSKLFLFAALTTVFSIPFVQAQEGHQHDPSEKLGEVNFQVSCTAAGQKQFNHALALLHSFQYPEAERAFSAVSATDPNCAMSYWGVAMSHYHPLWEPPNAADLQAGATAIERARSLNAGTQRERDYIAALSIVVALDELTGGVINDHRFSRSAGSDLQEEMVNRLALSRTRIAKHHAPFGLLASRHPDPNGPFFETEVTTKACDRSLGQAGWSFQSSYHPRLLLGPNTGKPRPLICFVSRAYSVGLSSRIPRNNLPSSYSRLMRRSNLADAIIPIMTMTGSGRKQIQ